MVVFSHIYRTGGRTLQKMFKPTPLLVMAVEQFAKRPNGHQFTQVRNPFAWQLSVYKYIHRQPEHPDNHIVKNMTLFEYLTWLKHYGLNTDAYNTQSGFLKGMDYDFIGRLEKIEESVVHLAGVLKVDTPKMEWITDSKKPVISHRGSYNKKERLLLEELFAEDLEQFGYEF